MRYNILAGGIIGDCAKQGGFLVYYAAAADGKSDEGRRAQKRSVSSVAQPPTKRA